MFPKKLRSLLLEIVLKSENTHPYDFQSPVGELPMTGPAPSAAKMTRNIRE